MDETSERQLLESYAATLRDPPAAPPTSRMAEVARRLRLEAVVHDQVLSAELTPKGALEVVTGMGHVLEQSANEVSVMVKSLFLGVNRTVVTASVVAEPDARRTIHLRAATLEGRWSWHTSARVLKKLRRVLDAPTLHT